LEEPPPVWETAAGGSRTADIVMFTDAAPRPARE